MRAGDTVTEGVRPLTEHADGCGGRRLDSRWALAALGVILVLCTAAWSQRLDPYLILDDESFYVILGKDLAETGGYRDLHTPGEPRHQHYPPGYPLIIAAVFRAWGGASPRQIVIPLKLLNFAFLLGSVGLFYALQRGRERPLVVYGSLFLFAFHPVTLGVTGAVYSEPAYLFFSLLGILALERLVMAGTAPRGPAGMLRPVLAGAATAWPVYLRMNGIALGVAGVGTLLLRRRWRQALLLGGIWLAMMAPLFLASRGVPGAGYVSEWFLKDWDRGDASPLTAAALVARLAENVSTYPLFLPDVVFMVGRYGRVLLPLAVPLVGGCLLAGLVGRLREENPLQEVYVVIFLLILLPWPARNLRYLLPVFPFLHLYIVRGVATVAQAVARAARLARPERTGAAALAAVLAGALVSGVHFHLHEAREAAKPVRQRDEGEWGWLQGTWEAIHWIGSTAPYGALTMLRKPYLLYVNTGRQGVAYPWAAAEEVIRSAETQHVQYIVEDASERTERFLSPALSALAARGRIALAYETAGHHPTRVWRLEPERVSLPGPPAGAARREGPAAGAEQREAAAPETSVAVKARREGAWPSF